MPLPPPSADTTVVVTGASSGIGADLARELSGRGYHVTLVARRADRLQELADDLGNADVRPCDLQDADARGKLVEALHSGEREVVGVCNNAGYGSHGPAQTADVEREVGMVRLNCEALHHLTLSFLPRMVDQGIGAILNVASLAAMQPLPNMATYAATKAFVLSFSEAVHADLQSTGVSVTALCPGPVHTEFGEIAGVGHMERSTPELAYVDAEQVAREGVEAMVRGRRTVVPSLKWKATGLAGRYVPRALLLPVARRVG